MTSKEFSPWVPFDLYDFFGYFFPGIFIVTSLCIFTVYSCPKRAELLETIWLKCQDSKFLIGLFAVIFLVFILYIIGHFVATLSHIVIDRIIMSGIIGYPIVHLLQLPHIKRDYAESSLKYIFILFNLFIIAPLAGLAYAKLNTLMWILLLMIIFWLLLRMGISIFRSSEGGQQAIQKFGNNKIVRFILLHPCEYIDAVFSFLKRLFSTEKPFPSVFVTQYKLLFKEKFKLDPNEVNTENYWLPYFYLTITNDNQSKIIRMWLHLYSFARNIAASAFLICLALAFMVLIKPELYSNSIRIHIASTLGIAWIFTIRYWILYTTYYTKNIIRSFVILELNKP